jgi:hypothetical protein
MKISTKEFFMQIAKGFYKKCHFPHYIKAINTKLVGDNWPSDLGSMFCSCP